MIESFAVFTHGGAILWQYHPENIQGNPLDNLVKDVLMNERNNQSQYIYKDYLLKWIFANDLNLVFVIIQLRVGIKPPVEKLLNACKRAFIDHFGSEISSNKIPADFTAFEKDFEVLLQQFEASNSISPLASKHQSIEPKNSTDNDSSIENEDTLDDQNETKDSFESRELERLNRTLQRKQTKKPTTTTKQGKSTKKMTKWDDTKLTKSEISELDYSDNSTIPSSNGTSQIDDLRRQAEELQISSKLPEKSRYWDDDDTNEASEETVKNSGFLSQIVSNLVGSKQLKQADLQSTQKSLTDHLIKKNVAPHVADQLVSSVVSSLEGKTLGSFTTVYREVRRELEKALRRLLTPKKDIDILVDISKAQSEERPYSIVFCGVNGVGKSTSLAKIAAYLISQGLKVGVAACDTFRSGAIEQLRTHCTALNLPLYDKGYGKDEAVVAADCIIRAKKDNLDVILIDTAGRMQGNEGFMKGLAKLMTMNNPDLVLFVGEALVGNDGCEQLINFNRQLKENGTKINPRTIDGIVLTKFDTIDDKIGAAISMTYSTGHPILFVGVGQTYKDLKRPSPEMLINALLK